MPFSWLPNGRQITPKEFAENLFQLIWIDGLSQDPAPRAKVGHSRSPQGKQGA